MQVSLPGLDVRQRTERSSVHCTLCRGSCDLVGFPFMDAPAPALFPLLPRLVLSWYSGQGVGGVSGGGAGKTTALPGVQDELDLPWVGVGVHLLPSFSLGQQWEVQGTWRARLWVLCPCLSFVLMLPALGMCVFRFVWVFVVFWGFFVCVSPLKVRANQSSCKSMRSPLAWVTLMSPGLRTGVMCPSDNCLGHLIVPSYLSGPG